jgi:uncharacterized protein (UPF0261 family)
VSSAEPFRAGRILVVGTLDTKGAEVGFLKEQIEQRGHRTVVMDIGILGQPGLLADIPRQEVVRASGRSLQEALDAGDRQRAVSIVIEGARWKATELHAAGALDGIIALGGGTALFMGTAIMQALPIGVPKLVLSSMVSGDVSRFVGGKDITLMQSVADIVGLNPVTRDILARAAGAICGMVEAESECKSFDYAQDRTCFVEVRDALRYPNKLGTLPLVAVTAFGITTPCSRYAAQELEEKGYETVVFHAVGSGGTAMEELIARDLFAGVLDLTTHEFIDHLTGGYYGGIGPERLETAGQKGIPQVVGPGGLDCIAVVQEGIPAGFQGRKLYYHDFRRCARPSVEELTRVARVMAERLNRARGPVKVLLPLRGWSEADKEGGPLCDPEGNRAFGEELKRLLKPEIEVVEVDAHINEPLYAKTAVTLLERMMENRGNESEGRR